MDEIDNTITKKLVENCRVTYRELAEITDMSVSAIHKRINKLVDEGNIEAFVARPSIIALKSIWFIVSGTSKAKSVDDLSKELGQHENIDFVGIAGGKFMYIAGYLRNISELQELSTFISKTAQISEPTVGIIDTPYMTMIDLNYKEKNMKFYSSDIDLSNLKELFHVGPEEFID